jgi:iron complex outermembrane receptor protein
MFRYSHALAARAAAVAACALALAGGPAAAQSPDSAGERSVTLTGTLVDPAGAPIPQVSVGVTELRRGTTTGEDGRYEIPSLPPGVYHVSFQRLGYAPSVLRITLTAATHVLDATLTESRIELPGTQVTASGTATTPLTSPQPTSVLEGEALRQARTSTLGGTLEQLPGLRSWSTGSGIGKPAIRGLRSDRVVIASNDMRLESQQWGDEHGPQVETADIERIEVIRGQARVAPDAAIKSKIQEYHCLYRDDPRQRAQGNGSVSIGNVEIEAEQECQWPCNDACQEVVRHREQRSAV